MLNSKEKRTTFPFLPPRAEIPHFSALFFPTLSQVALIHNRRPSILTAPKGALLSVSIPQRVIDMYSIMVLFFWFLLVLVVYYFLNVRNHSELDYHTSMRLYRNVETEKRKDPRADINRPVSMETSGGTIEAEARNISLGGALICCKKPFPIGEVFRLTMIGPDSEPLTATMKVARSNVNLPPEKVVNRGMGVRFIRMSDRHIQLVQQISQGRD